MEKTYHIIFELIKSQWKKQTTLFLLVLLNSSISLLSPYITKIIIDKVFPFKDYNLLLELLVILTICYIIRVVANYFADITQTRVGIHITSQLRSRLFDHIIRQPLLFFHDNSNGKLVYKLNTQIEYIESFITNNLIKSLNNLLTVIGITIMLTTLNAKLFFVSIILVPLLLIVNYKLKAKVKNLFKAANEQNEALNDFFYERLKNIRLIKLFNTFSEEGKQLSTELVSLSRSWFSADKLSSIRRNSATFIIALSPLLVFGIGGKDIIAGTMSIGSLVAFLQYLNRLFSPISELTELNTELVKFKVAIESVYGVFDQAIETEFIAHEHKIEQIDHLIFENVSFFYQKRTEPIIDELNIELKKGASYALVGKSGCGKSTFINLLCKLYPTNSGTVKINGISLNDLSRHFISKKVSLVTQDSLIFNATILENLKYGARDSTFEEICEVCDIVGLTVIINGLKSKFDTMIGHNGDNLSGGQKQRLSIARALLRNSDILILDEATSALDSHSENLIIQNIQKRRSKDCILLIISHRFSCIKDLDHVLLMKDGQVTELRSMVGFAENLEIRELFKNQIVHE
ncbi:hypothetical protein TH53_23660 [Pedobacter lusitanus]|uniref:ABC transporter ATP-binding protein n=1 Tax=Pedobacter lusitanus TaxID=1503925 RepID=A0A0D0GKI0_9SPHI|nr:ABC transporter ATP-binding protein [Pedobacter lusitanus]KIO74886.1 hypothetical protein TH53_23660 [Pedobacter lusitanus]